MIQTSSFKTHERVHFKSPVSIALFPRQGYAGRVYSKLAPPVDLKDRWYAGTMTKEEYVREYKWRVLSKLNPVLVVEELGGDAVLLCHEDAGEFCHRHIVAEWLIAAGIPVTEYSDDRSLSDWF